MRERRFHVHKSLLKDMIFFILSSSQNYTNRFEYVDELKCTASEILLVIIFRVQYLCTKCAENDKYDQTDQFRRQHKRFRRNLQTTLGLYCKDIAKPSGASWKQYKNLLLQFHKTQSHQLSLQKLYFWNQ
jgi:hypothetical protein